MISIDKLKQMALKFKTKRLSELTVEIDNHPNPKKTLMHQFDSYEEEREKYKSCEVNDDYSIVEDEAKEIFDGSVIKKYDEQDLKNLSKELIDVHVQLIDFIEKKTKNENVCQTPISVQNIAQNTVKNNQIVLTIKDAFDKFIEYKDLVEKLSIASLRSYDSAYKYILLLLISKMTGVCVCACVCVFVRGCVCFVFMCEFVTVRACVCASLGVQLRLDLYLQV